MPNSVETWKMLANGCTVDIDDAIRAQMAELDYCQMTKRAPSRIKSAEKKVDMLMSWSGNGVTLVHIKGGSFKAGYAQ